MKTKIALLTSKNCVFLYAGTRLLGAWWKDLVAAEDVASLALAQRTCQ